MAFSFGSPSNTALSGNGNAQGDITTGRDLEVIVTEGIGFLAIAGDAKVQLTSKWQTDPSPSSSLLSIASRRGLVAAAGPDALYVATTDSVRKAFDTPKAGDSNVRPFAPQAKIELPTRVSQLAFTADEVFLILSAEAGGGLAVYDVRSLGQGSSRPVFELPTNGEALRALIPNPAPELAFSCVLVTEKGNLVMANLKDRSTKQLATQVACAAWSTKGKQVVAGLADGTVRQMTPDGADKGLIPKPPGLGNYHVSSILWLENNVFLVIHTPSGMRDKSIYHIVTRNVTPASFVFQKLTDPVDPFVDDKIPHHFLCRLKDFSPTLQELLIISSTASEDLGLFTRSKTPLSNDKRAASITNVFTTTGFADDSKRAQIPMSEEGMSDTFPVGVALDLSGKDRVYKPIPTDEIEQSPGPLPAVWALNNEGVLAAWWVVHNESIRTNTSYPHLAVLEGSSASSPPAAVSSPVRSAGAAPASGMAFGAASPLGPKPSSFGSSPFGAAPAAPAAPSFGTPSFGSPSFGAKPTAGAAFGQTSTTLGTRPSPWGAAGSTLGATPAFSQSGLAGAAAPTGKVFGASGTSGQSTGGFAAFSNAAGFAALGGNASGGSIFSTPNKPPTGFGAGTPEVSMDTDTRFLAPAAKPAASNGMGSTPFVLGTTFKADPETAAEKDEPKAGGGPLFGSGFTLSLGDATKQTGSTEARDADMDAPTPVDEKPRPFLPSTTPTTTPAAQRFSTPATAGPAPGLGLFGQKSQPSNLGSLFGTPVKDSATTKAEEQRQQQQEEEDKENKKNAPEAPLPPATTSKAAYPLGESSSSSGTSRGSPETVSKTPLRENEAARLPAASGPVASTPPARESAAKTKPKSAAEDAPLPPNPFVKSKSVFDGAPLPPNPFAKPKQTSADAGSAGPEDGFLPKLPTVDVPGVPAAPGSADGEEGDGELSGDEADEGLGSEGSGVDVARDISPTTTAGFGSQTPGFTPQSSFGGMGTSTFSTTSRLGQDQQQQQRTLFGEIHRNAPAPMLPRPQPISPRSPSPVRSAVPPNLLRPEASRSVSAPGMASQLLGASARKVLPVGSTTTAALPARPPQAAPRPPADPTVSFADPEDDARQMELNADLEPTLDIAEFLAVESKLPELSGTAPNLGEAVVSLFRDVNRMLDTLGINARALKGFTKGHTELGKANGRTKEDLDITEGWVLCEVEDCKDILEHDLGPALDESRVEDVDAALRSIDALSRDAARLRAREEDLKRVIAAHVDPDQVATARSLPLSAEQAAQQNDLRRAYAKFSKLVAQAEEELTVLKARLASWGGGHKAASPTVEAVMRTIAKMTAMAEKRSGDVDVLETQVRKLRLGGASVVGGSPASREGSPRASTVLGGSSYTSTTPQRRSMLSLDGGLRNSVASTLASSTYSPGGRAGSATPPPPRRKVSQFSDEETAGIRQRQAQRRAVLQQFRAAVERNGPVVSRLSDEDA